MMSHVLVLALAWFAYAYLRRRHKENNHKLQTRVLSLSAFASSIVLLVVTIGMTHELRLLKFSHPDLDVTDGALIVAVDRASGQWHQCFLPASRGRPS
jgi:Co/Zn/Cd efflux system component